MQDENDANIDGHRASEQPRTIDPSLLNRTIDLGAPTTSVRRKLVFGARTPVQVPDDAIKRPKARNADVLYRAREMGKKMWTLEKLLKILDMLQEADPYKSALVGHGRGTAHGKTSEESNLLQLLQNERVSVTKELHYFKGPYIYIYDIEEKTKPVMVREYQKVADKKDGDWPQFRVASQGRCPFIEDYEPTEKESRAQTQTRAKAKPVVEAPALELRPPAVPPPKPVTGKRTLVEMEDGNNRGAAPIRAAESFDRSKVSNIPSLDFRSQNAFMSHAKAGRLLAGEPVASGVQPSNITSAIRSQMISSTTGALGAKAGTSKEIHGLQRKVLQKASTPAVSNDSNGFIRSASLSRATARKLDVVEEDETVKQKEKLRRTASAPVPQVRQKARDPKPGYCENCQDKFDDFEDVSFCPFVCAWNYFANVYHSILSLASTGDSQKTTPIGSSSMPFWANSSVFPGSRSTRNGDSRLHHVRTQVRLPVDTHLCPGVSKPSFRSSCDRCHSNACLTHFYPSSSPLLPRLVYILYHFSFFFLFISLGGCLSTFHPFASRHHASGIIFPAWHGMEAIFGLNDYIPVPTAFYRRGAFSCGGMDGNHVLLFVGVVF